ncbi:hypothetical protein AVEN_159464-1 [Araneus ventricosus]|uniref:Uncharacterized protein n=1 Tax=Araneus ventricosus TaxID=182803 RepID=A0A4Y2A2I5_ARAVE|nr:hypothetical protein AVEN_159464-1 [Araneus ventricosus]
MLEEAMVNLKMKRNCNSSRRRLDDRLQNMRHLSQDVCIPSNEREPTSSDGCFAESNLSCESENKENSSITIDSQHANTSGRRWQKRNKKNEKKSRANTSLSKRAH